MICPQCLFDNPSGTNFCGKCGTQLPAAKDQPPAATETLLTTGQELTTGSTFAGRYQVIEELGQGGMGTVYKVLDMDIKEKVALKLLRPEIALDKATVERFSNELKLARKISHRNVCRMFDLGKAEGTSFITMEFVPGEDLKKLVRKTGQLGAGRAVSIAKQVGEGLAEAHRLGVVHRDLKPQNIMIDEEGNAKIMDFGIARSLQTKGNTAAGVLIGTPEYMSPEQVEGKDVDQRSDIYSLGIILYEMLTGRVPFEGDTPFAVGVKQKGEKPRDPREVNSQIPENLGRLVLRCLEKDREKRYQTAGGVIADLDKIESGLATAERPAAEPVPPSVAVLPFVDVSPKNGHEYLCEGIPNTLINALTSIRDLRVPARTSAFSFVGKGLDIKGIGRKLNVENVLEGSIQVVGNDLRVTASLVKVADGYQLWNSTYDRKLEDVFAIQDDIARSIVKALEVKLLGDQQERLVRRSTDNMEAYGLYLEGLYYWNKRTVKDLSKAIELFTRATERDPDYALAQVGLADSYSLVSFYGSARPVDTFPRAKAAAAKALEIDDSLAEAHNSLAIVYERYDWNWKAAETEFKRALELNPNYALGHFWYGELLAYSRRFEEGVREMRRALELDPVSLIINGQLGWTYSLAGEPARGIVQLLKTLEMEPTFAIAHMMLGLVHLDTGDFGEAIDDMKKARELSGDAALTVTGLGQAYAAAGQHQQALGILKELQARSQKEFVSPYRMAGIYAAMGDFDRAFELANEAYEERDENLIYAKIHRPFDPVRSDPRYQALLKKVGLDEG